MGGLGQKYLNGLPDSESGREVIVIRNNISPKGADGNFGKYTAALDAFVANLVGRGYKVIYVAPAPKYYSLALGGLCSPQWFRPSWALSPRCSTGYAEPREEQLARRQEFFDHLIKLVKMLPGFLVFDPFETLCGTDTARCSPVRDGKLMYRDESHLTEYGSERLNEPFWRFLQNNRLAR